MKELTIDRKYVPEVLSINLLEISKINGLPTLKLSTLEYFITKGIITKYYSNMVKFLKESRKSSPKK